MVNSLKIFGFGDRFNVRYRNIADTKITQRPTSSNRHNILPDRTKDRMTIRIQHLEFHRIKQESGYINYATSP